MNNIYSLLFVNRIIHIIHICFSKKRIYEEEYIKTFVPEGVWSR